MIIAKQSTAITFPMGPFIAIADGSLMTGLTINQAAVRLSKNGSAFGQKNDATNSAHMENANYAVAMNATDTASVGNVRVFAAPTGAWPRTEHVLVLSAPVYDSLIAGSQNLPTDAVEMDSAVLAAILTGVWAEDVSGSGAGTAGNLLSVAGADTTATLVDAVWDEAMAGHAVAGSAGAVLSDVPTTAEFNARTLPSATYFDPAIDPVIVNARTVEDSLDELEVLRILLAYAAGRANGGGTTTVNYRNQANTLNRITKTVDADGNTSSVTLNLG